MDLSHNQLKEIDGSPFRKLSILLNLDLSSNAIISLNSTAFKGLGSLLTLDVSHNNLTSLPSDVFSDLLQLIILRMILPLRFIPSQTFAPLHSLQYLTMPYVGSTTDIIISEIHYLTGLKLLSIAGLRTQ